MATAEQYITGATSAPAVPSETLDKHKAVKKPEDQPKATDFIKKLTSRLDNEEREADWARYSKSLTNEMMYTGNQYGRVSRATGKWEVPPEQSGVPRRVHNWWRGFSRGITAQRVLSRPDLQIYAIPWADAKDEVEGGARAADRILDYYETVILTEPFLQKEDKLGQFTGDMFRLTVWDKHAGYPVKRKQVGTESLSLAPSAYACASCGNSGPEEALEATQGQCPDCGSDSIQPIPVPPVEMPNEAESYEVMSGDISTEVVPSTQVKFDTTGATFADGVFVRRKRQVRWELVQELCPWWQKQVNSDSSDYGQRVTTMLRKNPGNLSGSFTGSYGVNSGGSLSIETVTVTQWWFKPCLYGSYVLPEDLKLGDPEQPERIIPKGTKFRDAFPSGLYVMLANEEPIDFRDEDFNDHWQHTPYDLVPGRVGGDGLEDLNEPQAEVNLIKNLKFTDIKANAAGGNLYRPEFIKGVDYTGDPNVNVPVSNGFPLDADLSRVVAPLPRPALPAHAQTYDEEMLREAQWMTGVYSTTVGAPDVADMGGTNTATGASIMKQGAAAQRAPELALRAYGDITWAKQVLKLFKANATDERFIPFFGKSGDRDGQSFKGMDVPDLKYLLITVKRRSYTPKSEDDRRGDFMSGLQAIGGLQGFVGLTQLPPAFADQFLDKVNETFDLEFDLDNHRLDARVCRKRLQAMLDVAEQAEAMGEMAVDMLLQAAAGPLGSPVDPDADDHPTCIAWWRVWLHTDEADEASPAVVAAGHQMIALHRQAQVQQAQQESMMQLQAQAPQMQAQQAMQQQQMEQQQQGEQAQAQEQGQQAAAQAEQQGQQQAVQASLQEQAAQAQRQHDMQMAQMQGEQQAGEAERTRQHQLELEREKQKGQLAAAKAKPKGASK